MKREPSLLPVLVLGIAAAALWFVMFSPWTAPAVNFWLAMTCSAGFLGITALAIDRRRLADSYRFLPKHLAIGVLSAALLYGIFFVGRALSTQILPFAEGEIGGVYATRAQAHPALIGLLLLLWIGPAEEVFWRGLVQRRLAERTSPIVGLLVGTFLYTLVHVWSMNLMLLGAAAICGLFWGAVYMRWKSVWPGLISHALWDVVIFVVIPLD